jgi:hypothetical protein
MWDPECEQSKAARLYQVALIGTRYCAIIVKCRSVRGPQTLAQGPERGPDLHRRVAIRKIEYGPADGRRLCGPDVVRFLSNHAMIGGTMLNAAAKLSTLIA